MAYFNRDRFETEMAELDRPKPLPTKYFEERKCRFGKVRFSVMLPRKAFADLAIKYPPVGAA